MSRLIEQIKMLYDQQLYSNVISLTDLVLSHSEHNSNCFTAEAKFQAYVYYADSLFYEKQYRRAEAIYRKALQFKKSILKYKGATKPEGNQKDFIYDIDIKYNIHVCHIQMKGWEEALSVLQSIPVKQRTPKVNMALAKLWQQTGSERSAIVAYKEVLRECPLALEAVEGLLSLNERGVEVNTLILDAITKIGNMDWLISWIKAHSYINIKEYSNAVSIFKTLDQPGMLNNNVKLITLIGECLYKSGDLQNSLTYLQRAYCLDRNMQRGLDLLVSILHKENKQKDIEKYISPSIEPSEYSAENWIALAYHMHSLKKWTKAAYYAQKACNFSPRNIEALILKGIILYDLKRYQEAIVHFREAMQISSSYDSHKGLVDCFVATHRLREALSIAHNACALDPSSRTYTLYAMVLAKDPLQVYKARTYLNKALGLDESYLPAVYLLSELYERDSLLDQAIEILEKQLRLQTTWRLHQMLGDLYFRNNNVDKALDHYTTTLNLDPTNRRAIEGMHRIDHASTNSNKLDSVSGYCMSPSTGDVSRGAPGGDGGTSNTSGGGVGIMEETVEIDATYESVDSMRATASERDDSETEAVWSDMDLEVGGSQ
ncbi:anaphase-promoting complex subunit 7 [Chrysoperla carnea]|uniref:anaphase-promoting complex subunit 7 n=1 Tax=Chrysoperla carnea TaxID=189513 RepID=UPI001D06D300|nr:anaphase-promoting complex subunit 7 [Chrysoperla carnea]